jgi:penicillin-binding protein 2
MYSAPSYDPNSFVGGFEPAAWRALNTDPGRPLFNRAVTAAYAPGSTFKPVIAGIALREGYAVVDTKMQIPCRGALMYYGRVFHDWTPVGHGSLDLHGAIRQSCDVYFYQLGLKISLDGVDERYGRSGWTNSVVLNLAIGQGENAQSPLKMAQIFAALANGGTLPTPRVAGAEPAPEPAASLPLDPEQLTVLRNALVAVLNEPTGTARGSRLRDWTLAGKTGTAQNPHGEDHAWFVSRRRKIRPSWLRRWSRPAATAHLPRHPSCRG